MPCFHHVPLHPNDISLIVWVRSLFIVVSRMWVFVGFFDLYVFLCYYATHLCIAPSMLILQQDRHKRSFNNNNDMAIHHQICIESSFGSRWVICIYDDNARLKTCYSSRQKWLFKSQRHFLEIIMSFKQGFLDKNTQKSKFIKKKLLLYLYLWFS